MYNTDIPTQMTDVENVGDHTLLISNSKFLDLDSFGLKSAINTVLEYLDTQSSSTSTNGEFG